uniref:valine--tRNA ligase n=1 Tax=Pyramimonas obovata TaxID=1411642 RepID=A0A7S0RBC6_9CHLO
MAADACQVVRDGTLEVLPRQFEGNWFRWLENIRDWCISRQLWWGHRIPAYYVTLPGETEDYIGTNETISRWVVGRTYDAALAEAQARFPGQEVTLTQDPDVLDTWFSSGLFPFSTMGWPNQTPDLADFFPGALLETGHDILFFWVARMVMMSMTLMDGKVPFKQVYLHAMVRDAHGRKMSKSLGNVIDPLQVIEGITLEGLHAELKKGNLDPKEVEKAAKGQKEDFPNGIPECGTDALRFALVAYTTQARDINLDIQRVHGYRTWCNKLYNAIRFAMMNLPKDFLPSAQLGAEEVAALPMCGQWIVSRLNKAVAATNEAMDKYDFATSTTAVYAYWQYDLCDVFIELMKPLVTSADAAVVYGVRNALWWALDAGLRLLHPFMPFITEELWQRLPRRAEDLAAVPSIMLAAYPVASAAWAGEQQEQEMELLVSIVKCLRQQRAKYGLTPKQKTAVYVTCATPAATAAVARGALYVATLSSSESVEAVADAAAVPAGCAVSIVSEECSAYIMLKGIMDPAAELAKLDKRFGDTTKQHQDLHKRMDMATYQTNVPENVQQADKDKATKLQSELATIEEAIAAFKKLQVEQ